MDITTEIKQRIYNIWQVIIKYKNEDLINADIHDLKNIEYIQNERINVVSKELATLYIKDIENEIKDTNDTYKTYYKYIKRIEYKLSKNKSFREGYFFEEEFTLNECLEFNFSGLGNVSPFEFLDGAVSSIVMQYLKQELNTITENTQIKLIWNGKDYQLYNIFQQLKDRDLILNTNVELAYFIKLKFYSFDKLDLEAIQIGLNPKYKPVTNFEKPSKLKWNGTKAQLYDIFRQLRNSFNEEKQPYIGNSYTNIAEFIRKNIEQFSEKPTLRTIIDELEREERPKKNPIDISIIVE